jgi:signal transduction histidine kinase
MGEKPLVRRGMELGADDYLTKPFTLAELEGAIRAQLGKKAIIAQQAEHRLEELRGNISTALPHELLTPLAGILGFSALIIDDHAGLSSEEIVSAARDIQAAALRLRRTIENFLLRAQIELVSADPDRLAVVRSGRCQASPDTLRRAASQAAVEHRRLEDFEFMAEPALVSVAPEQLEKIAAELVGNAFKFSEPGTVVQFRAEIANGSFRIRVEDQGRGFTREQIQSIGAHMQFERGYYEQQGAGLGLSIVKRLAELHGGRLEIESEPGRFSRICVQLPLATAA